MSYCLNPHCKTPENLDHNKICISCGKMILLDNRYRPISFLGGGGQGRNYLAIDEKTPSQKRCVIKQFSPHPNIANNPNTLQKATELFNREATILEQLGDECTQIPRLLAHLEQECFLYFVQEFIDGQNLLQELNKKGNFSELEINEFLHDILPVLKFIHNKGVIHRDIKPENIMRRKDGLLVLIDFGLSKKLNQTISIIGGTMGYAPPEQLLYGQVSFSSDLYALGATCIHLLTGIIPEQLYNSTQKRWLWQDILSQKGINISNNFSDILSKMLKIDVANRYQSVDEVLEVLQPVKTVVIGVTNKLEQNILNHIMFNIFNRIFNIIASPDESNSLNESEDQENLIEVNTNVNYITAEFEEKYNLRERQIEEFLLARNLPGLFDKLIQLKGLQVNQNYTLRWLYAVGGQSIVYLGEDSQQSLVIIKIPYLDYHRPAYISQDKINQSRINLLKEAEFLQKFNHTNLPNFYDLIYGNNPLHSSYRSDEIVNQEPYLVMEFIAGEELLEIARKLHKQSKIDYEKLEVLAWATISKMIDFCITIFHEGYLYSDINPLNLILTNSQNLVRILDAGSLIPVNPDSSIQTPFTESYIPVEYFEAYEQGNKIYPNQNYVMYSIGKMLWEILTNKQPYPGENPNLNEPILQNYSTYLKQLINDLIQNKYNSFDILKKAINSVDMSI